MSHSDKLIVIVLTYNALIITVITLTLNFHLCRNLIFILLFHFFNECRCLYSELQRSTRIYFIIQMIKKKKKEKEREKRGEKPSNIIEN